MLDPEGDFETRNAAWRRGWRRLSPVPPRWQVVERCGDLPRPLDLLGYELNVAPARPPRSPPLSSDLRRLRPNWWNPGRCAWCIRWFRRAWPPCCIRSGRDPGLIRARRHHRLCRATWRRQWSLTIAKGTVPLDRLPAGDPVHPYAASSAIDCRAPIPATHPTARERRGSIRMSS